MKKVIIGCTLLIIGFMIMLRFIDFSYHGNGIDMQGIIAYIGLLNAIFGGIIVFKGYKEKN